MSATGPAVGVPCCFYVYYRVVAGAPHARAVIASLLADVAARSGIEGRLLTRCDDTSTWMEVYEAVDDADAFARTLDRCVRQVRAAQIAVDGRRTVERFSALAPAAAPGASARG